MLIFFVSAVAQQKASFKDRLSSTRLNNKVQKSQNPLGEDSDNQQVAEVSKQPKTKTFREFFPPFLRNEVEFVQEEI